MKRRIVSLLLLVTLLFGCVSFVSCTKNRTYDEAEVKAAAERLLEAAKPLNTVWYGGGIAYIHSQYQNGYYYEADPAHLYLLGIETLEELKVLTRKTFSESYAEKIFETNLGELSDDNSKIVTKYYQAYDELNPTVPARIMVYHSGTARDEATRLFDDRLRSYDYSTLEVVGVKGEILYLRVTAVVANEDGKEQRVSVKFNFIEEADGWKIAGPCFANYNESLDN